MSRKTVALIIAILVASLGASAAFAQGSITVNYSGMDQYVGKALYARIVDPATGAEVEQTSIPQIAGDTFAVEFSSLTEGAAYRIDFYVDLNKNGRYDPPPVDHAWRIEAGKIAGATMIEFVPSAEYTDIDWPPLIDGVIEPGEYRHSMTDPGTGMDVHWRNDDLVLYIGLVSPGTGWEAIGFSPTRKMQGANIIIGAVNKDGLVIEDHYGSAPTSHRADKESQILQAAGREADGKTVIEFAIPLATDDPNDVSLQAGIKVTIILAYHQTSDRLTARHTKRSTNSITLDGEGG